MDSGATNVRIKNINYVFFLDLVVVSCNYSMALDEMNSAWSQLCVFWLKQCLHFNFGYLFICVFWMKFY